MHFRVLGDFWNYIYLIPLFAIGVLFLLILLKKHREQRQRLLPLTDEERESLANPIAITAILFTTLIYVTFFSNFRIIVPYPLDVLTLIWYGFFLVTFWILCVREKRRYHGPPFEVKEEADLSLKYEVIRKTTHTVIMLVIVCYIAFGPLFMSFVNWLTGIFPIFGVTSLVGDPLYYGQYTVAFLTVIAFLGLSTSEIVRVFFYSAYPLKAVKKIFRQKELGSALGSHISLTVGSMAVILIFGPRYPDIVMASISISAIADGAASIVGRKLGTHQYKTVFARKKKTWEGLLTGTIVSLILSFSFLMYRFGFLSFFLAFVATGMLDLIDLLSIQISDNLLNPIVTSTALVLVANALGVG